MLHKYVFDQLHAPRLTCYGRPVTPLAHIELGNYRAGDVYYRDELPFEGEVARQLREQDFKLVGFPYDKDLRLVAYLRHEP